LIAEQCNSAGGGKVGSLRRLSCHPNGGLVAVLILFSVIWWIAMVIYRESLWLRTLFCADQNEADTPFDELFSLRCHRTAIAANVSSPIMLTKPQSSVNKLSGISVRPNKSGHEKNQMKKQNVQANPSHAIIHVCTSCGT
jgi:hypothetical protein